ncbi:flagellar hook assembly protein FlgD [Limoniibacter endophyticus]|uniref:Basal-body rod modification protein FlgD n=1 Tax=Limoniibacter endophyticus TaxID=1565040 RepID=A0A8J3DMC2_9HYPH|nr:flagellar hook assembly protein FlgD [Limoniibacter endophyticus]GHC64466.1 flagellar basal body rod modification protein FlgD [Limoniibacter endophyticus]
MTTVSQTSGVSTHSTSSANATSAASAASVDYQSFLKLLIAQMQNQDPTAPMDATQYVSQLATFSQVEQTIQTNNKLDQIMQSSMLSQAGSIIGLKVTSADGETSGIVKSVKLYSDGMIATLDTGAELAVGPGVTISPAQA